MPGDAAARRRERQSRSAAALPQGVAAATAGAVVERAATAVLPGIASPAGFATICRIGRGHGPLLLRTRVTERHGCDWQSDCAPPGHQGVPYGRRPRLDHRSAKVAWMQRSGIRGVVGPWRFPYCAALHTGCHTGKARLPRAAVPASQRRRSADGRCWLVSRRARGRTTQPINPSVAAAARASVCGSVRRSARRLLPDRTPSAAGRR